MRYVATRCLGYRPWRSNPPMHNPIVGFVAERVNSINSINSINSTTLQFQNLANLVVLSILPLDFTVTSHILPRSIQKSHLLPRFYIPPDDIRTHRTLGRKGLGMLPGICGIQ